VLPNITIALHIFISSLHQWLQVNALSMCWKRLKTITVQLRGKILWIVSSRSITTETLHERHNLSSIFTAFSEKRLTKSLLNKIFNLFN
jgi:hypothetical protein